MTQATSIGLALVACIAATAASAAAPAGLCSLLNADDVATLFGKSWTLAEASPAGGANTCYYTLKSGTETQLVGVKVDPGSAYDLVANFLTNAQPVAGLGDKAVVGKSGGSTTYVISANGKTISTNGGRTDEQSRKLAELILNRRP
jgi:hypothetical protein